MLLRPATGPTGRQKRGTRAWSGGSADGQDSRQDAGRGQGPRRQDRGTQDSSPGRAGAVARSCTVDSRAPRRGRSEERRVGKECGRTGKSRGARYYLKKKNTD